LCPRDRELAGDQLAVAAVVGQRFDETAYLRALARDRRGPRPAAEERVRPDARSAQTRQAAFALESVSDDVYVLGPSLVALLAASGAAWPPLAVAALAGNLAVAMRPAAA